MKVAAYKAPWESKPHFLSSTALSIMLPPAHGYLSIQQQAPLGYFRSGGYGECDVCKVAKPAIKFLSGRRNTAARFCCPHDHATLLYSFLYFSVFLLSYTPHSTNIHKPYRTLFRST